MRSTEPASASRRTWHWVVGGIAVLFLLILALAMWSEREDAQRLPDEVDRRGEETWRPEPVAPPAVP